MDDQRHNRSTIENKNRYGIGPHDGEKTLRTSKITKSMRKAWRRCSRPTSRLKSTSIFVSLPRSIWESRSEGKLGRLI